MFPPLIRPASASAPSATVSARTGDTQQECRKKPLPSLAAFECARPRGRRAQQEDHVDSRAGERAANDGRFFDRHVEHEHAIDPAAAARSANASTPIFTRGWHGEQHEAPSARPQRRHQFDRPAHRGAGGQRALGRSLNDRAVRERIGEWNADLQRSAPASSSARRISPDRRRSGSPAVMKVTNPVRWAARSRAKVVDMRDTCLSPIEPRRRPCRPRGRARPFRRPCSAPRQVPPRICASRPSFWASVPA